MKNGSLFLITSAVLLCTNAILSAEEQDVWLTDDSIIQDGDDYDDVFVYGDDTVVHITGGEIGKLWSRNGSTVHINSGRITFAESHDSSTINITGGIVTEPSVQDAAGTINVSGGICWNIEVSNGVLNIFGGQIAGMGISVPSPGGVVNIHGYGFEYYPLTGLSDGRLRGYWRDGTAFSIGFLRGAYQAAVLHEISTGSAPVADAGQDRTVFTPAGSVAQVILDGSASSDPDGDALTYEWTWTLGEDTFAVYGPSPTIMLPAGKHAVQLIVSDGKADSKPDQVIITVQTLDQQIRAIRAEKLQLIDALDSMLAREQQIAEALGSLLIGGNYANLPRDHVLAAREAMYSSTQYHEQSRKSLETSIERLEEALLLVSSPVEASKPQTTGKN